MAALAVVLEGEDDPVVVHAVQILVSLRSRKLRERPAWLPVPPGEASSSSPGTAAPEEEAERWARRRPRSGGRRGSSIPWMKALRLLDLAAAAPAASGGDERNVGSARRPVEATLYYSTPSGSGSLSTSFADRAARAHAAAPDKEPMKAPSPDTPLDYGAGGSGASSSADDGARLPSKRKGPGACGYGGSRDEDDEGCSSPAKRARVAAGEEKPIPAEPILHSETRASSGKVFAIDLNLPPPSDDDGGFRTLAEADQGWENFVDERVCARGNKPNPSLVVHRIKQCRPVGGAAFIDYYEVRG